MYCALSCGTRRRGRIVARKWRDCLAVIPRKVYVHQSGDGPSFLCSELVLGRKRKKTSGKESYAETKGGCASGEDPK